MPRTRIPADTVATALSHLKRRDPVMRSTIRTIGPFTLRLQTDRFRNLVRAIIAQQISTSAARSILARLEATVGEPGLTAESLTSLDDAAIRSAGVSPQKLAYLRSLCEHALDGSLDLRNLGRRSDEAVVESLLRVKGIGLWTAQMFLMFSLGRLDVLPHGDLGIRSSIRQLYDLPELPNRTECEAIAAPWRPYASIASWYLWRTIDVK